MTRARRCGPGLALLVALLLTAVGCAVSQPAKQVPQSGFLADYSRLHKGDEYQAELVYVRPGVPWKSYDKILLDPVTVWRSVEASNKGISQQDAQALADYFYGLIRSEFSQQFKMVRTPEPNTLRVAVALTQLGKADVVLDVISTVEPHIRAATSLYQVAAGGPTFEGEAAVEARLTDAMTGQILAEGVDKRIGTRTLNAKSMKTWGDVENIMQYWVARSAYNLCRAQERSNCQKPTH
ncbi:MAG: DUF3313 domain-containing protein [candidate division NC10 bacterium]|nr:DUF3313 domain-containing protein [candidate division NC10 bacterium]